MYHDHSQAIYQILLTHYLHFVFSHHFCSFVFSDITFIISIFFLFPVLKQTIFSFKDSNKDEFSGVCSWFLRSFTAFLTTHSCSRMNYFSATISFLRLLICYLAVVWSRRLRSSICGVWCCCCLQLLVPQGGQLLGLLSECWFFVVLQYGGDFIWCHLCQAFNSEIIFNTVWLFSNVPFVVGKVIHFSITCLSTLILLFVLNTWSMMVGSSTLFSSSS